MTRPLVTGPHPAPASLMGSSSVPPLASAAQYEVANLAPTYSYPACADCVEVTPVVTQTICQPCQPCQPRRTYLPPVCATPCPPPCPPPCAPPCPPPCPVDVRIVDDRGPKIEKLEQQLRDCQHQLGISEDLEERLRRQLEEQRVRCRVWSQKEAQINALDAEIARLKAQMFEGDLRLVASEGQRAAASEQIAKLEQELHIANSRLAQAQQVENELAEVQRQLLEARQRLSMMEHDAHRSDQARAGLESQLAEANERLYQLKSGFENERGQYRQQLQELGDRLRMAEQQRDEALNQCHFFEVRLREAEERLAAGDKGNAQLRAQFEAERTQLQEQLFAAQQRFNAADKQLQEAQSRVAFLEGKLREAESRLAAAEQRIQQLQARIQALEAEIANLRARLTAKPELHSQTSIKETYKVKTFEIAAKLAVMDGTDDGMYNGLPIEVEGEGLYKDLVAKGRRPKHNVSLGSLTSKTSETYKVQSFEMAERLSKMDGTDSGMYNGLPIEVVGEGLYNQLRMAGRRAGGGGGGAGAAAGAQWTSGGGGGAARAGGAAGGATAGSMTSGQVKGGETYIVTSMDIAATLSRMGGTDDGTYKGLPIEIKGMGLYRDLRAKR